MINQILFFSSVVHLIDSTYGYQMRLPSPKYKYEVLSSNQNPCDSIIQIDPQNLSWPYQGPSPYYAEPSTKIYNSTAVTDLVNALKAEIVPGLPSTFGQTFSVFQNAGCLLYIHGGGVRDFLLGLSPKDIDVEYSCSPSVLETACVQAYGNVSCHVSGNYFYVGEKTPSSAFEELEGVNWNGTIFAPPFTKEYTTNALSFDLNGNDVVIDIVGSGVNDTCSHLIRIPVPKSDWLEWMTESEYFYNNGLAKLPRFWKLAATPKSYLPADNETLSFIKSNVEQLWDSIYPVEDIFRKFYCNMVSGKLASDGSGCYVNEALSVDTMAKLDAYNIAIENDMGSQWYHSYIVNDNVNKIIINSDVSSASALEVGLFSSIGLIGIGLVMNSFDMLD